MAAGTVTSQFGTINVASNACSDVVSAYQTYFNNTYGSGAVSITGCSTNPVAANTAIQTYNSTNGASAFYVNSITATPTASSTTSGTSTTGNTGSSIGTVTATGTVTTVGTVSAVFAPFDLSASDGALVGVAIMGVWAAAFAFKAAIRALNGGEPER